MFRFATYNIRKCVGLDWRRRPERTMRVIGELHADVVALQEADRRLGKRPATLPLSDLTARTGLTIVPVAPERPSSGHHGNALLVREGIHVARSLSLDLPSLEPRGALIADLEINGFRLRAACVHLGLRSKDRRRQARALLQALQELDEELPTVVLGDLNEWAPHGVASAELSRMFQPSRPLPSFHSSAPLAPLDRIFVGPGLRVETVRVHRSMTARRASDHLPVCADVSIVANASHAMAIDLRKESFRSTT